MSLAALFAATGLVQGQAIGDADNIAMAQRLFRAAFPDLLLQPLHMLLTVDGPVSRDWTAASSLTLRIGDEDDGRRSAEPFLRGVLTINVPAGHVRTAVFSGPYVHSRSLERLTGVIKEHDEWNDEDVDQALKRAGAKYPPSARESFMRDVNLVRFVPALGTIHASRVAFEWRYETMPRNGSDVTTPHWVARMTTIDRFGRVCFALSFEPIDGLFTGLGGRRCAGGGGDCC